MNILLNSLLNNLDLTNMFAQVQQTRLQFARVHALTEAWHWLLLVFICALLVTYVVWMYRRDAIELRKSTACTLILLRVAALVGILFFFLNLERLTEETIVKNSRVHVLVDTSQSMGLRDDSDQTQVNRISHVVNELAEGETIQGLRENHDVLVYRFSENVRPTEIAAFPRVARESTGQANGLNAQVVADVRKLVQIGLALLALATLSLLYYLFRARHNQQTETGAWSLLTGVVLAIAAVVVVGVGNLRHPELSFTDSLGITSPDLTQVSTNPDVTNPEFDLPDVDWASALSPRGTKTRLGDAIEYLVTKERGGPIAGIVVYTDGRNNSGESLEAAARIARGFEIPLYPIGIGSDQQAKNVRIVDMEAPQRVYPGDNFKITGYIQAFGYENTSVTVELISRPTGTAVDDESQNTVEEQTQWDLGSDGQTRPVEFEIDPDDSLEGKRDYIVRIQPPKDDNNPRDNQKSGTIEIVTRRNRVLLIAGGPTREYRFLRNLLYRDREIQVDVFLQTGEVGISQEADDILFDFPQLDDELFQYDCVVAFDPDWQQFDDSQLQLLEKWVSENAGGLIVVAGPVFTPEWSRMRRGRRPGIDLIKNLYPVVFYNQGGVTLSLGRFGGDTAWPVQFSNEGLSAEFLWLDNDQIGSEQAWASFDGVFGYYKAKDPKPGAKVYARFSDPETAIDQELPIYMAGHFYGAGRVFYQASGEMWRLRSIEEDFFEKYYTKLIRWAAQGRLLRDSNRGVLLTDKDRCFLGEHISLRAKLTDAQRDPLTVESVTATLVNPDGTRDTIELEKLADATQPGMYVSQFIATQQGDYRIELALPGSSDLLTREVRVRVPQLEIENPRRDDAQLSHVAQQTSGHYFIGVEDSTNTSANQSLTQIISAHDQETELPGTPDRDFEQRLMGWLIALISGVLCFEWIIRRLSKLA